MKPHRQIIHAHHRVSGETGVAVGAEAPRIPFYSDKLQDVKQILAGIPHVERRRLISDIAIWIREGKA